MSTSLTRKGSKRKRDEPQVASPTKRRTNSVQFKGVLRDATDITKENSIDELEETRKDLLKIFSAIEVTLLSTRSMSSFHSIQQAVRSTSRRNFEMSHLAQVLGVWPEAYEVESMMALVNGVRVPSLSIARPYQSSTANSSEARTLFASKLKSWTGQSAKLPNLEKHTLLPLNTAKITSIQKSVVKQPDASSSPMSIQISTPTAKARQSALLDRIKMKALTKSNDPTPEDLKSATISALIPAAVTSIKILLASRRTQAIGMTELCDNLGTSLSHRLSRDELRRLVEQLSRDPKYAMWCKIGDVGDVRVVRFIGRVPSIVVQQ